MIVRIFLEGMCLFAGFSRGNDGLAMCEHLISLLHRLLGKQVLQEHNAIPLMMTLSRNIQNTKQVLTAGCKCSGFKQTGATVDAQPRHATRSPKVQLPASAHHVQDTSTHTNCSSRVLILPCLPSCKLSSCNCQKIRRVSVRCR